MIEIHSLWPKDSRFSHVSVYSLRLPSAVMKVTEGYWGRGRGGEVVEVGEVGGEGEGRGEGRGGGGEGAVTGCAGAWQWCNNEGSSERRQWLTGNF